MITGTVALALAALGRETDPAAAQAAAETMWHDRPRRTYPATRALTG